MDTRTTRLQTHRASPRQILVLVVFCLHSLSRFSIQRAAVTSPPIQVNFSIKLLHYLYSIPHIINFALLLFKNRLNLAWKHMVSLSTSLEMLRIATTVPSAAHGWGHTNSRTRCPHSLPQHQVLHMKKKCHKSLCFTLFCFFLQKGWWFFSFSSCAVTLLFKAPGEVSGLPPLSCLVVRYALLSACSQEKPHTV